MPTLNSTMYEPQEELVIEAGRTAGQYWKDLWRYRELFIFLSWRDILIRYKQTLIGATWSIIRPLITMIVFTIIFEKLAKMPSGDVPYPILVFCAMIPWQLFANTLAEGGNSLINNANMLSKVYFPRLVAPASVMVVSMIDFLVSFGILAVLMIWYRFIPSWHMITIPLFTILALAASMGGGLWLAALNVKYRDFRHIIPFMVQFGLYVSPVGFSTAVVPEKWRLIYSINPMVGVIDGFRWAILGGTFSLYWPGFLLSLALVAGLFASGVWYFRKTERTFADII
jgi:lipopolysaccharide transport system permease protein